MRWQAVDVFLAVHRPADATLLHASLQKALAALPDAPAASVLPVMPGPMSALVCTLTCAVEETAITEEQ